MHWCPIKHTDHASRKCFDKSSTYTANNRGDNMPPYLTLFEIVKKLDVDWPYMQTCLEEKYALRKVKPSEDIMSKF